MNGPDVQRAGLLGVGNAEGNGDENDVEYETVEMVDDVLAARETAGPAVEKDAEEDDAVEQGVGIVVGEDGPGGNAVGLGAAADAEGVPEAGKGEGNCVRESEMADILLVVGVDTGMAVEGGTLPMDEADMGNVHDRDGHDGRGRTLRHGDESGRNDRNDGVRVHGHHEANESR